MMDKFTESLGLFRNSLREGWVITAYRGLMEFMMGLRTQFARKYPDHFISGSLYQGYMDMSYFAIAPRSLIEKKLKIAIVFNYPEFQFEVYLIGVNKKVQSRYIQLFRRSGWDKFRIAPSTDGFDFIVAHPLIKNPDFSDLTELSEAIESGVAQFDREIEGFLNKSDK
jgi:hypothetical protein